MIRRRNKKQRGCKRRVGRKRARRGRGFINDLISKNALPELHLRGFSGKYNFAGPFTRLDKRLNADGTPKEWSKPINDVDKSAYYHDLCYGKYTTTHDRNNICDKKMLEELGSVIKSNKEGWRVKADARIVQGIIGAKKYFGIGRKRIIRRRLKEMTLS